MSEETKDSKEQELPEKPVEPAPSYGNKMREMLTKAMRDGQQQQQQQQQQQ